MRFNSNPDIKIFLIGNKSDLEDKRKVTYQEGYDYMKLNKLDYFCESSAKTGFNTNEMFMQAAKICYQEYKNCELLNNTNSIYYSADTNSTKSFKLKNKDEEKEVVNKKSYCRC